MSAATALIHLEIDGDALVAEWHSSKKVEFSFLRTLSIISIGDDFFDIPFYGLMEGIVAPRLEILVLSAVTDNEMLGFGPFGLQFPALHTIALLQNYSVASCLDSVRAVFPDIRHIMFNSGGDEDDDYDGVFAFFSFQPEAGACYWPHLHTVAIPPSWSPLLLEDVRDMLVSRTEHGHPLQKLYLPAATLPEFLVGWYSGPIQIEEFTQDMKRPAWWLAPSASALWQI